MLEYAKVGTSNWQQGAAIERFNITDPVTTTAIWNVAALPDSMYNVRLKMVCVGGNIVYTPRATGILDRRPPFMVGKPQPGDNNFATGDEISFTYSENINVNALNNNQVTMQRVSNSDAVPVTVSGFGNKIIIVPSVNLFAFTGDSIRVIVKNISDLNGNVNQKPDTLYFVVGTAPVVSGTKQVKLFVTPTSRAENASGEMAVHFKLPSKAANVTQVYFNISGTAKFGSDYTAIADTVFRKIRVGNTSNYVLKPMVTLYNGSQGYIFIDSGATETVLHIRPIADSLFEADETVAINLTFGGDYTLTDSTEAVATILNDDLAPPVITANGPLLACVADSVTLTATAPAGVVYTSYKWNTGATTQSISVNKSSRYSVTAKDAANRTATSSVYIGRSAITSTFATANPLCFGGIGGLQVNIIGGVVPYRYKFDSLDAEKYQLSKIFKPIKAGTYKINIKDSIGCVAKTASIIITEPLAITGTFTKTDATCIGKADGTITVTTSGGKAPYGYKVGLGGVFKDGNTITGLKAGSYTIYVKDVNGCIAAIGPVTIGQANINCLWDGAIANAINTSKNSGLAVVTTPNPSASNFTLRVFADKKDLINIRVLDINGRVLLTTKTQPEQPLLFGSNFAPGTYLVEALQGEKKQTMKLVKLRK